MDASHFDALVRHLQSRRGVIQTLLGGGAALGLAPPVLAGGVTPCDANGSECDPLAAYLCCTGNCKRHKGKHRCAPAGVPFGCKKKFNACSGKVHPCPEHPSGICVRDNKGKPLCVNNSAVSVCVHCQTDGDCVADAFPTARCLRHCKSCKTLSGGTACVIPAPIV